MNIKRIPLAVLTLVVACAALGYFVGTFRPFSDTNKFSNVRLQNAVVAVVETIQPQVATRAPIVIASPTPIPPTGSSTQAITTIAVQETAAPSATAIPPTTAPTVTELPPPTVQETPSPAPVAAPEQPTQVPAEDPALGFMQRLATRVAVHLGPTATRSAEPTFSAPPTIEVVFVAQAESTVTAMAEQVPADGTPTATPLSPEDALAATQTAVPAIATLDAIATRALGTRVPRAGTPDRAIAKSINFLLIGTDSRTTDPNWVPNTDVMMVLFLDSASQRAALFSLPRDLVVAIPGQQAFRINSAYRHGWLENGVEGGVGVLKDILRDEFGIRIDHWALIDFDGLSEIIDVLGGIEVNVPCALTDTIDEQAFTIPAGPVQMDYLTAKRYVQSRYTTSDTSRNHRQQRVVWAMAKKALSLNAPDRIPLMYTRLQQNIATDMTLFDMIGLVPAVYQLDLQNYPERMRARVLEAPAVYPWVMPSGAWVYMPNYDDINLELDTIFDAPQVALNEATRAECPTFAATPAPTDMPTETPTARVETQPAPTTPEATIEAAPTEMPTSESVPVETPTSEIQPTAEALLTFTPTAEPAEGFAMPTFTPTGAP